MSSSDRENKPDREDVALNRRNILLAGTTLAASAIASGKAIDLAQAQQSLTASGRQPNILVIMGDDVGWFNIGAYHRGIMSGKTPNLDKLAAEGMLFTDYYAEASCTAGRANFITGEIPLRTGLTTVGQAGADVGMPDQACTLATALKAQGYATGQFGKNHLGDLNKFLPTRARLRRVLRLPVPPRRDVGSVLVLVTRRTGIATSTARATWSTAGRPTRTTRPCMPRWGKVGKQKIVDEGPLPPFPDMTGRARTGRQGREGQVRHGDLRRGAGQEHRATSWTRPRRTASRSSSGTTRRACTS